MIPSLYVRDIGRTHMEQMIEASRRRARRPSLPTNFQKNVLTLRIRPNYGIMKRISKGPGVATQRWGCGIQRQTSGLFTLRNWACDDTEEGS